MRAFHHIHSRHGRQLGRIAAAILLCLSIPSPALPEMPVAALAAWCRSSRKVTPIDYVDRNKVYSGAIFSAGTVYDPSTQKFSEADKRDGIYLYLVVRQGARNRVVWSLRAPGEVTIGKNLVIHDSLFEAAKTALGAEPEVIAAGQVSIINGLVPRIDNRSRTRPGGPERIELAETPLKQMGLNVQEGTRRLNFSGVPEIIDGLVNKEYPDYDHHTGAEELANLRSRIERDPRWQAAENHIRAWHAKVYQTRPDLRHPSIPGYLDLKKMFGFDSAKYTQLPEATRYAFEKAAHVMRGLQIDGIEFAVHGLTRPVDGDAFALFDLGMEVALEGVVR